MGDMKISSGHMVSASAETREAIKSAKDAVAKHAKAVKDIAGDTGKDLAKAAAVGAAVGAVSPLPGGMVLGGVAGAAAAAGAKVAGKAAEQAKQIKSTEKEKIAVKSGLAAGLVAGPALGLGTYLFVSGKAKEGCDKMIEFIKKHPDVLLATPNQAIKK